MKYDERLYKSVKDSSWTALADVQWGGNPRGFWLKPGK
jgi:hypothetical protein